MPRRKSVERDIVRRIILTYIQSLQILEGDRPPEDFFSIGTDFSPIGKIKARKPKAKKKLDEILSTKFPYNPDPQQRRESDTGWIITNQYKEVDWSKVSYRIGIREIGLNNFIFAPVSSRVSIPIESPRDIWKIVLKTKEEIPGPFSPNTAWIEYYVSVDDGQKWYRINPLDKPTRFSDDGTIVPRILTINSEVSSNDPEEQNLVVPEGVRRVRMKYVLYADQTVEGSEGMSPIIKSVQLLLYPRSGLSDSSPEQI